MGNGTMKAGDVVRRAAWEEKAWCMEYPSKRSEGSEKWGWGERNKNEQGNARMNETRRKEEESEKEKGITYEKSKTKFRPTNPPSNEHPIQRKITADHR